MLPQYGTEHTVTVAHLEGGQAALEAAVGEAVGEQGEVSAGDALAADLLQLALLHQVPPRPDKLPVSQPRLQLQHRLEFVLEKCLLQLGKYLFQLEKYLMQLEKYLF